MKLVLHNYWRSSASHRVRIALGLKGLAYEYSVVNIVKREQDSDGFRARNPQGQVPALEVIEDDGSTFVLTQSLPIIEYLDERFPSPPVLPKDPYLRARARALAEIINSGIQPLQNLTTTNAVNKAGVDTGTWVRPFINDGLLAFARAAADVSGQFCVGDTPSIADCCLVPQLASARRFQVPLEGPVTKLLEIEARCLAIPAFAAAMPDQQIDAGTTGGSGADGRRGSIDAVKSQP